MKRVIKTTTDHICGKCKGDGRKWVIDQQLPQRERGHWEVCPDCMGSGMVTVQKEIHINVLPKRPTPVTDGY